MTGMGDMERLMSRIVYGTAGARDLVSLRAALEHLPEVQRCLEPFSTGALAKLGEQLETLEDIAGASPPRWWTSRRSPSGRAA